MEISDYLSKLSHAIYPTGYPTGKDMTNNIEREYPHLRKFILDYQERKHKYPNYRLIISHIMLESCPILLTYKNKDKINFLHRIVINYVNIQLQESGCSINLSSWLLDNKIIEMEAQKNNIIKKDELSWMQYSLNLPSDDRTNLLLGKQFIFIIPSLFKLNNNAELYRMLLGDLTMCKIQSYAQITQNGDHFIGIDVVFDVMDIIKLSSIDYLYSLYKCRTLNEIISLNIDKNDISAKELLDKNIFNVLWTKFILITEHEYSYSKKKLYYDNHHDNNPEKTYKSLIRCIDDRGNINISNLYTTLGR